jgi:hypothetical protein
MDHDEARAIVEKATQDAREGSPILTVPVVLDSEALKSHEPTMAEKLAANPPKRGPGRPPGRKNNSTLLREQGQAPSTRTSKIVPPRATPQKVPELSLEDKQKAHAVKIARAEKLADDVAETINDNMMLLLMAMGVPTSLLYKPGMEPTAAKENSKYTPLAQQLALGPMQSQFIGRFLAEMEATETGGKIGASVSEGKGPLILYGILSGAAMIQWGKGLMDAYKNIEPMLKAFQAEQTRQQQEQERGA